MLVFVLAGTLTPSLPRDYSISHSLPGMHRTPTYGGPRCSTRRSGRGSRRRRPFGRVCSSRRTDTLGGRPRGRVVHREHPSSTAHDSRSEAGRDTSTTKRGQRISRSKYATARHSRACSPGRSSSEPVRRGAPPHSRRASAGRRTYGRAARRTPSRENHPEKRCRYALAVTVTSERGSYRSGQSAARSASPQTCSGTCPSAPAPEP